MLEVRRASANRQRLPHESPLKPHLLVGDGVVFQVVRGRVHDGETGVVGADPDVTVQLVAVRQSDIAETIALFIDDVVVAGTRVAVLPEERSPVGSRFSRDDDRGASHALLAQRESAKDHPDR